MIEFYVGCTRYGRCLLHKQKGKHYSALMVVSGACLWRISYRTKKKYLL
jgi:hypothetical protein